MILILLLLFVGCAVRAQFTRDTAVTLATPKDKVSSINIPAGSPTSTTPGGSCGATTTARWFKLTGTGANCRVTMTMDAATVTQTNDGVVEVWRTASATASSTFIGCDDDLGPGYAPSITFSTLPGYHYFVSISSRGSTTLIDPFTVHLECDSSSCEAPVPISVPASGTVTVSRAPTRYVSQSQLRTVCGVQLSDNTPSSTSPRVHLMEMWWEFSTGSILPDLSISLASSSIDFIDLRFAIMEECPTTSSTALLCSSVSIFNPTAIIPHALMQPNRRYFLFAFGTVQFATTPAIWTLAIQNIASSSGGTAVVAVTGVGQDASYQTCDALFKVGPYTQELVPTSTIVVPEVLFTPLSSEQTFSFSPPLSEFAAIPSKSRLLICAEVQNYANDDVGLNSLGDYVAWRASIGGMELKSSVGEAPMPGLVSSSYTTKLCSPRKIDIKLFAFPMPPGSLRDPGVFADTLQTRVTCEVRDINPSNEYCATAGPLSSISTNSPTISVPTNAVVSYRIADQVQYDSVGTISYLGGSVCGQVSLIDGIDTTYGGFLWYSYQSAPSPSYIQFRINGPSPDTRILAFSVQTGCNAQSSCLLNIGSAQTTFCPLPSTVYRIAAPTILNPGVVDHWIIQETLLMTGGQTCPTARPLRLNAESPQFTNLCATPIPPYNDQFCFDVGNKVTWFSFQTSSEPMIHEIRVRRTLLGSATGVRIRVSRGCADVSTGKRSLQGPHCPQTTLFNADTTASFQFSNGFSDLMLEPSTTYTIGVALFPDVESAPNALDFVLSIVTTPYNNLGGGTCETAQPFAVEQRRCSWSARSTVSGAALSAALSSTAHRIALLPTGASVTGEINAFQYNRATDDWTLVSGAFVGDAGPVTRILLYDILATGESHTAIWYSSAGGGQIRYKKETDTGVGSTIAGTFVDVTNVVYINSVLYVAYGGSSFTSIPYSGGAFGASSSPIFLQPFCLTVVQTKLFRAPRGTNAFSSARLIGCSQCSNGAVACAAFTLAPLANAGDIISTGLDPGVQMLAGKVSVTGAGPDMFFVQQQTTFVFSDTSSAPTYAEDRQFSFDTADSTRSLQLVDFDGDRDLDIVYHIASSSMVRVLENTDGAGTFRQSSGGAFVFPTAPVAGVDLLFSDPMSSGTNDVFAINNNQLDRVSCRQSATAPVGGVSLAPIQNWRLTGSGDGFSDCAYTTSSVPAGTYRGSWMKYSAPIGRRVQIAVRLASFPDQLIFAAVQTASTIEASIWDQCASRAGANPMVACGSGLIQPELFFCPNEGTDYMIRLRDLDQSDVESLTWLSLTETTQAVGGSRCKSAVSIPVSESSCITPATYTATCLPPFVQDPVTPLSLRDFNATGSIEWFEFEPIEDGANYTLIISTSGPITFAFCRACSTQPSNCDAAVIWPTGGSITYPIPSTSIVPGQTNRIAIQRTGTMLICIYKAKSCGGPAFTQTSATASTAVGCPRCNRQLYLTPTTPHAYSFNNNPAAPQCMYINSPTTQMYSAMVNVAFHPPLNPGNIASLATLICPVDTGLPSSFLITGSPSAGFVLVCIDPPRCPSARRLQFTSTTLGQQLPTFAPTPPINGPVFPPQVPTMNRFANSQCSHFAPVTTGFPFSGENFFDSCQGSTMSRDGPYAQSEWFSFETDEAPHMYSIGALSSCSGSPATASDIAVSLWDQCDDTDRPLFCAYANTIQNACLQSSRQHMVRVRRTPYSITAANEFTVFVEKVALRQGGARCGDAVFLSPNANSVMNFQCLKTQWFSSLAPPLNLTRTPQICSYTPVVTSSSTVCDVNVKSANVGCQLTFTEVFAAAGSTLATPPLGFYEPGSTMLFEVTCPFAITEAIGVTWTGIACPPGYAIGSTGATGAPGAPGAPGVQGPAGVTGATGAPGVQGPAGATGAAGTNGTNGATGAPGVQGPAGQTGATGAPGAQGQTGATGSNGATGAPGVQGPAGQTGATGAPGVQGPAGATGAPGVQGPAGATGTNGATGAPGVQGPAGATGATGTNGATGAPGVQGPAGATGATGTNGATGAPGVQGPAGATGATGAPGVQGPAGATGATGTNGATGAPGPAGATGATGAPGAQGPAGATGATGAPGAQGPAGATGAAGTNGTNGATGAPGVQGPAGATGAAGTNGTNGMDGATGAPGAPGAPGTLRCGGRSAVHIMTQYIARPGETMDVTISSTSDGSDDTIKVTLDAGILMTAPTLIFFTGACDTPELLTYSCTPDGSGNLHFQFEVPSTTLAQSIIDISALLVDTEGDDEIDCAFDHQSILVIDDSLPSPTPVPGPSPTPVPTEACADQTCTVPDNLDAPCGSRDVTSAAAICILGRCTGISDGIDVDCESTQCDDPSDENGICNLCTCACGAMVGPLMTVRDCTTIEEITPAPTPAVPTPLPTPVPTLPAICGNGITEPNAGEQCDGVGDDGTWFVCDDNCKWAPFFPSWILVMLSLAAAAACVTSCCFFIVLGGRRRRRRRAANEIMQAPAAENR